jgi:hypothetical protein
MSQSEDDLLKSVGVDPSAQSEDELLAAHGVTDEPAQPDIGMGESFIRGGENGLSFGMAPRVAAMLEAERDAPAEIRKGVDQQINDFKHPDQYIEKSFEDSKRNIENDRKNKPKSVDDLYNEYLQLQNKKYEDAQKANPWTSFAGNLAGGLMLPIPGNVGIAGKAGLKSAEYGTALAEATALGKAAPLAAKYAPMSAKMADSAITGGLMGGTYGLSQSDDLTDPGKDAKAIGHGLAMGTAIGAAVPPAGALLKGAAQGTMELGRKVVGPVGKLFMRGVDRGMEGLPNLGTEAGKGQEVQMKGEFAGNFANDLVQRVKDLARNVNNKYNEVSVEGRQIPQELIDDWVEKQMRANPNINEKDVLSQLSHMREIINTAKDGHEVEQITRRFFGEGSTDLGKFTLQSEAKKMAQGLESVPGEPPAPPEPTPQEQFQSDVARKAAEAEALGKSGVGPVEIEHIPQDDGSTLAVAKQRTLGEEKPAFIPKKVASKRIDVDLNGHPDPEQWAEMQNQLEQKQAEQRATPHIDHPELELHLEPTNITRTDPETGAVIPQHVAVIREKGPADLGGDVDGGFKKIHSAVLPPDAAADAVPPTMGDSEIKTYPMDDHPGKVLAVEEAPILDAQGNVIGRKVIRSKVINAEGAAKWVDQKSVTREGGRSLNKIEQWQAMLDALRRKSKWSQDGSGYSTEQARQAATDAFDSGQQVLDQAVPEAVGMRKQIGHLKNIADTLGIDTYDFENNSGAQRQVTQRLQKMMNDLHNADDSGFNARKQAEDILAELEQVSPIWAREVREQMNKFGEASAMAHKLDKPFNALSMGGMLRNFTAPIASGLGHKTGQFIAKESPIVKTLANGAGDVIRSITPDKAQNLAGRAMASGKPALKQLATLLTSAANADERARNAILFGIMSQPGYASWIKANDPDQMPPQEGTDGQ